MDPFVAGSLIGGGMDLLSAIPQYFLGSQANQITQQNYLEQQRQNALNMQFQQEAFGKNYQHSLDVFDWQKRLQDTIFEREDNAIQRRAYDLKQAGLSPVLAAGQGARAGAAVAVNAPHLEPVRGEAPQRSTVGKQMQMSVLTQLGREFADISKTVAETEAIRAQTRSTTAQAVRTEKLTPLEIRKVLLDNTFNAQTLPYRFRITESEKNRLEQEVFQSYRKSEILEIQARYKKELDNWLKEKGKEAGGYWNPDMQEYLRLAAAAQIANAEAKVFGSLPGGAGMMNEIFKLIAQVLRYIK